MVTILKHSQSIFSADRRRLVHWYRKNARELPWRVPEKQTLRNPYLTWISEIMLQQTQVTTVIEYFNRWKKTFPDLQTLAAAPERSVLQLWSGLGYYSRAKNLHQAAKMMVEGHGGRFPASYTEVLALPGVGAYTAGAIMSLSYGMAVPILDGNLIRIFSRYYGYDFLPESKDSKAEYWDRASQWSASAKPHIVNEGLMELGALVCTRKNPGCDECPLRNNCYARLNQLQGMLPPAKSRPPVKEKRGMVFVISHKNKYFMTQKSGLNLLKDQWMFLCHLNQGSEPDRKKLAETLKVTPGSLELRHGGAIRHSIMHYRILLEVYRVVVPDDYRLTLPDEQADWVPQKRVESRMISALSRKIWEQVGF